MNETVSYYLDPTRPDHYALFLRIKGLPRVRFHGRTALVPVEYAHRVTGSPGPSPDQHLKLPGFLFDYQRDIVKLALRKQRFAVFAQCGLGKTQMLLEYARQVKRRIGNRNILIVCPLMVVKQTLAEAKRFYGDRLPIDTVTASELPSWIRTSTGIGITNFEAIRDGLKRGNLGSLIIDESSCLKSHYGKWGQRLIELGAGLTWKLCLTGTPAPNDRIEYANHAVFLDRHPTINAFLARYFVNRGQTDNRWELKPHALRPFYRDLSDWCIFLENPATYGWKDNVGNIPPIKVTIHDVDLTDEQATALMASSGMLVAVPGGITKRGVLAQISKGHYKGTVIKTNKTGFIRDLIATWSDHESTIVWCRYDKEQDGLASALQGAASISGKTPQEERERIITAFQSGTIKTLITKPKILGFGLNLQIATRQVFSSCQDSWEEFHQAVKRSNRIGSTIPLNVHIPVTSAERPMMENVLRKADRIQHDSEEQEKLFKEVGYGF